MDLDQVFGKIAYGTQPIQVPYFQRAYVWDKREWERLETDLLELDPELDGEELFLGSIIFKKLPQSEAKARSFSGVQILVDGQQRLTTLAIALKILALAPNDPDLEIQFKKRMHVKDRNGNVHPSIIHNRTDHRSFGEVIELSENKAIPNQDKSRIKGVYNFLRSALAKSGLTYNKLLNSVTFAVIQLDPNENEQLVFDATNSLGKPLSASELLKNFFFEESQEEDYDRIWKPVFEKDDSTRGYWEGYMSSTSRKDRIDTLIDAVLRSKVIEYRDSQKSPISKTERKKLLASGRVVNGYKDYVKKRRADAHADDSHDSLTNEQDTTRRDVVVEVVEMAKVFQSLFPASLTSDSPELNAAKRLAILITELKLDSPIPYVMYIKMNVPVVAEQDKMFRILENYLMRRFIADESGSKYRKLFDDILDKEIKDPDTLKKYLASRTDDLADVSDEYLKEKVGRRANVANRDARAILYLLEDGLASKGFQPYKLLGLNEYSLEHLMPVKWTQHWNADSVSNERAAERDVALRTLGNMALVTGKLNSTMSNSPWHVKVQGKGKQPGLRENANLKTMFGAVQESDWDVEQIGNRADAMFEKIKEVWPAATK